MEGFWEMKLCSWVLRDAQEFDVLWYPPLDAFYSPDIGEGHLGFTGTREARMVVSRGNCASATLRRFHSHGSQPDAGFEPGPLTNRNMGFVRKLGCALPNGPQSRTHPGRAPDPLPTTETLTAARVWSPDTASTERGGGGVQIRN